MKKGPKEVECNTKLFKGNKKGEVTSAFMQSDKFGNGKD